MLYVAEDNYAWALSTGKLNNLWASTRCILECSFFPFSCTTTNWFKHAEIIQTCRNNWVVHVHIQWRVLKRCIFASPLCLPPTIKLCRKQYSHSLIQCSHMHWELVWCRLLDTDPRLSKSIKGGGVEQKQLLIGRSPLNWCANKTRTVVIIPFWTILPHALEHSRVELPLATYELVWQHDLKSYFLPAGLSVCPCHWSCQEERNTSTSIYMTFSKILDDSYSALQNIYESAFIYCLHVWK